MQRFYPPAKLFLFFLFGAISTFIIVVSSSYLLFSFYFRNKVYPGVKVENFDLAGFSETQSEVFLRRTISPPKDTALIFSHPQATISATFSDINIHADYKLSARRAFSIGRQTPNPYYNFLQIIAAWQGTINLPLEVTFDQKLLTKTLDQIAPAIEKPAVNASFEFQKDAGPDNRGRVIAFTPSQNGIIIDRQSVAEQIMSRSRSTQKTIFIPVSTKTLLPVIKTSTADDLGIKTLLGEGVSYFYDSIPGRVANINVGASKISGSLVAPGEIFSFDNAIGTVSAIFGFQKAYVIKEGKTVLDDGGGVCQVSTTLYRAVLNAGLPVLERTAHTYRVGFYEQGGFLPGLDATVFPPSPDFKFKNDTGSYLLIQSTIDYAHSKLTFDIFGSSDGRSTQILGPYIASTSPPPPTIYEDDPTLPVGQTKQVDTAHPGAEVYFQRIVTRGNDTLISETVKSSFVPWPARYLKGTKV